MREQMYARRARARPQRRTDAKALPQVSDESRRLRAAFQYLYRFPEGKQALDFIINDLCLVDEQGPIVTIPEEAIAVNAIRSIGIRVADMVFGDPFDHAVTRPEVKTKKEE